MGKKLNKSFKAVLDLLDGIPKFGRAIREGVQFAKLGPSAMDATTAAQRLPHILTFDEVATLAADSGSSKCAPLPEAKVLPGAPSAISCVAFVSADMDGNGRSDTVAIWRRTTETTGSPPPTLIDGGAVVFLDDGHTTSLVEPFAQWRPPGTYVGPVGPTVVSMRGDRSQQVRFDAGDGASTTYTGMLVLGRDGQLHITSYENGDSFIGPTGGGVNYPFSSGCVSLDGVTYLAQSSAVPAGSGAANLNGGSQWSVDYFHLVDTTLEYLGRAGGYDADGLINVTDAGGSCTAGQVPRISRISKEPLDAASAASFLVQTATVPAQGLPYGRSVIGGPDTDGLWASGSDYDGGRIWKTLLERVSQDPQAWSAQPPRCDSPIHAADTQDRPNPPTLMICVVVPADGTGALHVMTEQSEHGWVVIGVTAKGE